MPRCFRLPGENAFTLLELLIVLSILAVIAVLGVTATTPSFDRNCLNAAADEIKGAVRFAQMGAATTRMAHRVVFDEANDRITVEQLAPDAGIWNAAVTVMSRSLIDPPSNAPSLHPLRRGMFYQVDFNSNPQYGGVNLSSAAFGAETTLTFDASGRPSAAGIVTLARGGRQLVVTVDGYSGEVTAQ